MYKIMTEKGGRIRLKYSQHPSSVKLIVKFWKLFDQSISKFYDCRRDGWTSVGESNWFFFFVHVFLDDDSSENLIAGHVLAFDTLKLVQFADSSWYPLPELLGCVNLNEIRI